jgi:hypothetical protein
MPSSMGPGGDIIQLIGMGQYVEASEIFGLVMQALEERVAELEPIDA